MEDQLHPVNDFESFYEQTGEQLRVHGLTRDDGDDVYDYHINLKPFQVTQRVNGEVSAMTTSLYFEDRTSSTDAWVTEGSTCFDGLRSRAQARSGLDIYANSAEKK